MTRIDFYILPDSAVEQRLTFACRLAQKALQAGSNTYIAVNSAGEAAALDKRLWEFRPESFLPHDCEGEPALQSPIAIGFGDDCGDHHDLLINLKATIPEYFSRFERLAEVVCQDEGVLTQTREHYGFYRHRGYPIKSHDLRKT
ncbi:DNA polymerase III subunit chi [Aestuariicella hydrocarbonica]|uniref:DNA polymerase III subunit chi n=1 Tax=Pseudomaricurvus hydrocarbonicus TaxID=1470433 RepID=A0A9E5JTC2_9GAMM|nr:DNA polymerase III subunit chi [Aestuariicella hydrocarbonica]NHO65203.1 DNA polymerase III subunit chi [Aestuariicella hydrocarbonica]